MKSSIYRLQRAYTLIELTIVMMVGMLTSGMVLSLVNQQLTFLNLFRTQNFLITEAPIISMYVSRVIGKADRFSLHPSANDAVAGTNASLSNMPVVALEFRDPNGVMRKTILAYRDLGAGAGRALYYYIVPSNGILAEPQWAVSRAPSDVSFSVVQGVLRMTLTGPAGEQIIYSGTMQQ